MKISETKKREGVYCCAYGCKNDPDQRKGMLCHKHYARLLRERSPKKVRYSQMKQKAKSRGISFTITLEWFLKFCGRTGYMSKGRRGQNATLDRRCNLHGYHSWNIQILTNRQNASKGNRPSGEDFDCPF
ncbi:endonuclease [Cellulophaga phage phi17:1]|uniref:Uncharacterized protein n=1 Tax=Cellulophaga phage phi17:1 TaxID=1327980 RepID=R9ZYA8_9CAUD|nr:endonuclease [Cellulophaga phage phi17:1]AGO48294.1 hypothetical protein Phi17:1_gp18 [Cellulophaga phage phi17:1]